jgi:hypothetical protein
LGLSDLRVEWLRCRARVARWKEEIQLIEEEMRRSIAFCEWKASSWDKQVGARVFTPPHVAEGIAAYAAEQAHAERQRAGQWAEEWKNVRRQAETALQHCLNDSEGADVHTDVSHIDSDADILMDVDIEEDSDSDGNSDTDL